MAKILSKPTRKHYVIFGYQTDWKWQWVQDRQTPLGRRLNNAQTTLISLRFSIASRCRNDFKLSLQIIPVSFPNSLLRQNVFDGHVRRLQTLQTRYAAALMPNNNRYLPVILFLFGSEALHKALEHRLNLRVSPRAACTHYCRRGV